MIGHVNTDSHLYIVDIKVIYFVLKYDYKLGNGVSSKIGEGKRIDIWR